MHFSIKINILYKSKDHTKFYKKLVKKLDKNVQSNKTYCLLGIILLIFLMIKIEKVEAQQSTIVYYNATRVYNITSGHLQIFNKTGNTDSLDLPPEGTDTLDGENVTTCSTNLIQSDNSYCFATSKSNNREPWIRFEFNIQEQLANITSVSITMEATSTGSGNNENGNFIHRNFSNSVWNIWASPARTNDTTRTITYKNQDITNVINASGKLMLLAECADKCDDGEQVRVDYVEVVINYTYNITMINISPSFNTGYPQINSTTGINQTTEDLFAIFSATDFENSTLKFNITWFTNNITNFTTALYNYSINELNISILNKANLTVGDTWIAMVNLFDGQLITSKNTTELLILNISQSTQTTTIVDTQTTTIVGSGPSRITQETRQIVVTALTYPDCLSDIDCNTGEICKYTPTGFYKKCVRNIQPTLENKTQPGRKTLTAVGATPQTTVGTTPTGRAVAVIGEKIKNILNDPPIALIVTISTIVFLFGIYYSIFKKK